MATGKQYYGGFFWVALVSFTVPFFVGWKAFQNVQPTTKPTPQVDASGVDHAVWDYLLKAYVTNGLVDYEGMKKDYLFKEYLREIGSCKPDQLKTREDKLALICNAYNALVINGVISHKIYDSVDGFQVGGTGFFDLKEHIYAGQTVSLNDIEHKMVRPVFREPRIHVALVCAARSCPAIRPEAYVGSRVLEQLQDQSRLFANSPTYVAFDQSKNELKLSPILSWYGDDWNECYPKGGKLEWLHGLIDIDIKGNDELLNAQKNLLQKIQDASDKKIKVSYFKYDWTLNSQAEPGKAPPKTKSSAKSGSGGGPDE